MIKIIAFLNGTKAYKKLGWMRQGVIESYYSNNFKDKTKISSVSRPYGKGHWHGLEALVTFHFVINIV